MPRRRRSWVLVFGLVLAAGGVLAWLSAGPGVPPPAHFWARVGQDPPELFESPGGRAITGWTAQRDGDSDVKCSSGPDAVDRFLAAVGLRDDRGRSLVAFAIASPSPVEGWREYIVLIANPRLLEEAVPDPDLVGDWAGDDSWSSWALHADGSLTSRPPSNAVDLSGAGGAPVERRWGCLRDVLVLLVRDAGPDWRLSDEFIVEPGKGRVRHWLGKTSHKVR